MCLPARLFGPNGEEIVDLDSWFLNAPPEKGLAQWKDGYSAKEQAKAWLRSGGPQMPDELCSAVSAIAPDADEVYGRPEHTTRLDKFSRARQHDLFACLRCEGGMTTAIGIEAKACENFDGKVADRAAAAPPSKKRARCNLLARALFGRDVLDEDSGELLDADLVPTGTSSGPPPSGRRSRPSTATCRARYSSFTSFDRVTSTRLLERVTGGTGLPP
jgi:hypothetical protein